MALMVAGGTILVLTLAPSGDGERARDLAPSDPADESVKYVKGLARPGDGSGDNEDDDNSGKEDCHGDGDSGQGNDERCDDGEPDMYHTKSLNLTVLESVGDTVDDVSLCVVDEFMTGVLNGNVWAEGEITANNRGSDKRWFSIYNRGRDYGTSVTLQVGEVFIGEDIHLYDMWVNVTERDTGVQVGSLEFHDNIVDFQALEFTMAPGSAYYDVDVTYGFWVDIKSDKPDNQFRLVLWESFGHE